MPVNQHFNKYYEFGSLKVLKVYFLVTQNQKAFLGVYQICLFLCCVKNLPLHCAQTFSPKMDKFHSFRLKVSTYLHPIHLKFCTLSLEHIQVRLEQKPGNKNIKLNFNEFILLPTFFKRPFGQLSYASVIRNKGHRIKND